MKSFPQICRMSILVCGVLPCMLWPAQGGQDGEHGGASAGNTVVDARGKIIGSLLAQGLVEIHAKGVWVAISISAQGFYAAPLSSLYLYYADTNCTGQAYMIANSLPVYGYLQADLPTGFGLSPTGTLYFPGADTKTITLRATGYAGGSCYAVSTPYEVFVGPVKQVTLDNFTLPFTVK